jgi:precorrin-4/cobalt-precorrin-4 C11-methyltransferase
MKVHFIGAGPGAADLITLRGARVLGAAKMVMFAGSLVSREMLDHCRADAEIVDTSALDLDEQEKCYVRARNLDWDVARLHSGDPAIYGATAEQMRRLDALEIVYEIVPGVSSFSASAAILHAELTKPEISQTIILTRTSGRASPVPPSVALEKLAVHRATLCIFLSGPHLPEIVASLRKHYPRETPIALVQKATWPQEKIWRGTLANALAELNAREWTLSTMMLVGEVLNNSAAAESRLYSAEYSHRFRSASERSGV